MVDLPRGREPRLPNAELPTPVASSGFTSGPRNEAANKVKVSGSEVTLCTGRVYTTSSREMHFREVHLCRVELL